MPQERKRENRLKVMAIKLEHTEGVIGSYVWCSVNEYINEACM